MLEWLSNNKEWLFSGIGITLLGLVYLGINKFLMGRENMKIGHKTDQLSEINSHEKDTPLNMTPSELVHAIDDVPPYQREEVAKHYVGLLVRWKGELRSASPSKGKKIALLLSRQQMGSVIVECSVNESDYPSLKVMKEGTLVVIQGKIARISYGHVVLKDAELSLYPRTT